MEKVWKTFEEKVLNTNCISIPLTYIGSYIEIDGKKIRNCSIVLDFEEKNISLVSTSYGGYIIDDDYKPSAGECEKIVSLIERKSFFNQIG